MVVYVPSVGKGVIISEKKLIEIFKLENEKNKENAIEQLTNDKFNNKYKVCKLGHDAFESNNDMLIFAGSEYQEIYEKFIQGEWGLYFIGDFKDFGRYGEFSIFNPEFLYGFSCFIKDIAEYYQYAKDLDFQDLGTFFDQKPLFWSFAGDCKCCI